MVNDEEINALGGSALEGHTAGVHCGSDFGDAPVVGELQAVEGVGVVFPRTTAGALVAEGDEFRKGRHEARKRGRVLAGEPVLTLCVAKKGVAIFLSPLCGMGDVTRSFAR